MIPPQHINRREFKDITVRELLAGAVEETMDGFLNDALVHCIAVVEHDVELHDMAVKINDFVTELCKTEEGHCGSMVLTALRFAMMEHINRMNQNGAINDMLDSKKN